MYPVRRGGGIYLGRNVVINSCTFHFEGKSNVVYIGDNVQLNNVEFFLEDCCNVIEIGDSTTMEGGQLAACEGTRIRIGADCMFAKDVNFRTTDSHSIISMSGKRLNKAADIIVGNHVWIGTGALLLKGTILPDNAVVAAKSVVTSQLLVPNAIYGGVPVKILKENISWCRERI